MCAIAGVLDLNCTGKTAGDLLQTMLHRGPDGKGCYQHKDMTLLHTRLAIIDPSGGAQPMVLDWAGERYVLVYNGELYNTGQLRAELVKLGHSFYGTSDTEVLLHGYAQWGKSVVDRCNGIFAFAVLEEKAGRVFLARDRIGVKPLFYAFHGSGLLFASEIKTILAYPGFRAELDGEGVCQILLLGPGRTPGSGVFHGIFEVEPGCCGYYSGGRLTLQRYWRLQDGEHTDSFEDTVETVRCLVLDAIRAQMVSDVPIGTFLSGGLDSSLITAVCAREMDARGRPLDTFSLDYVNNELYYRPEKWQPDSDTQYIRLMQQHLDTQHHWTVLNADDLIDCMHDGMVARDLPGMADIDTSLLAFCRQIAPVAKVALSGECADEIFGGYPWFRDPDADMGREFPWARNVIQRAGMLHPQISRGICCEEYIRSRYADALKHIDLLPGNSAADSRMKRMMYLNFYWFMQTLLERKDRMSMCCGLEVRVPFCDARIAQYAYTIPWSMKEYRGREKGLLRYAMQGLLPDAVLYRKKSPYPKTHDPAYLQKVSCLMERVLQDPHSPILEIVDRTALEQLLEQDFDTPWYGQLMRRPQTIAYMLQINDWMGHYNITVL